MKIELTDNEIRSLYFGYVLIFQRLHELEEDDSVGESDYDFGRYTKARDELRPIMGRLMGEQWIKDEGYFQAMRQKFDKPKKVYKEPPQPTEEDIERVRQNRLGMLSERQSNESPATG